MAATALPFAALFLPHPPRIEARVLAWSASLIALLAVAVAFAPLAERHIDVTTPATEFSSLSFASPMSGGVNRVTGPALVDVVYDGPAVSSDDLMATFSGAPVAPQTVTSAGGAHRLRYRFVLPADGCERTFSVRARPVDPGRRPSLRGDEAALDDASRSTLQLTTRFINGVSTLDCDGPADLQSASGGDEA
jgi:hypothetical protein